MFFSHGIKAVNMDGIASALGVSKRTIYESFSGKEELVNACLINIGESLKERIERINQIRDPQAALEAVYNMLMKGYATFYNFSLSFFNDLKGYAEACEAIEKNNEIARNATKEIYLQGVEAGLLKDHNDFDMLTVMWRCYVRHNMNESPEKRISPEDFSKTIKAFMLSLCTQEGKEMTEKIIS